MGRFRMQHSCRDFFFSRVLWIYLFEQQEYLCFGDFSRMARCIGLILRKRKQVVVGVRNREFGCAVKSLFKAVDYVDFVFDTLEEGTDLSDLYVEQEGTAVLSADHGKSIAETLKGLEHKGNVAVGDHGPDEIGVRFGGNGHDKVKAKRFVKFDGGSDVSDEEIGGERVHCGLFRSNILKILAKANYFFRVVMVAKFAECHRLYRIRSPTVLM